MPTIQYSAIYAFGDSLADAGNISIATGGAAPVSPPYSAGHFSNGTTWVEDLSQFEGLGALSPSLSTGTAHPNDYAFGGARSGSTSSHAANVTDLPAQLTQFQATHSAADSRALYAVSIGGNDAYDAVSAFPSNPAKALADINQAVVNVDSFVIGMAAHGAKNFVFLTVPDLRNTPALTSKGQFASAVGSAVSAIFDKALTSTLTTISAALNLNVSFVDGYGLLDTAVAHPAAFGFINVTDRVWTGNFTDPNSGTLRATTPAAQNQYLFFDGQHTTAQGHAVIAATAYFKLNGVI